MHILARHRLFEAGERLAVVVALLRCLQQLLHQLSRCRLAQRGFAIGGEITNFRINSAQQLHRAPVERAGGVA